MIPLPWFKPWQFFLFLNKLLQLLYSLLQMKTSAFLITLPALALVLTCCKNDLGEKDQTSETPGKNNTSSLSSSRANSGFTGEKRSSSDELSTDPMGDLEREMRHGPSDELSAYVRELLAKHPDQAHALLEAYTSWLFENDHLGAVEFAILNSHLVQGPESEKIASRLLNKWKTTDQEGLQTHLHTLAIHGSANEFHCHQTLKLLIQGDPGPDGNLSPEKWVEWIDELSKGQGNKGELQAEALNALLGIIEPKNAAHIDTISKAYQARIEEPGMQKHLPEYGDVLAKYQPEKTAQLLEDIPPGLYREHALERVIAELGRSHPEVAAEWLSSQDVLEKIYRPQFDNWKEEMVESNSSPELIAQGTQAFEQHIDAVFDKTLETYLFSLVHEHPEDAMTTVESMIDDKRRETVRNNLQAIVNAVKE